MDLLQIYINIYSLLRINYISSQLMIFMPPTKDKQDKDLDFLDEEIEEGEIDLSSLTEKEKEDLILEMYKEEVMEKYTQPDEEAKVRKKKRKKKKREYMADRYPGFGKVVIRMGTAMAFSMAFILIGPLLFFMSIFKAMGERGVYDWYDLLFGVIGIGLTIAAWFLFRYLVKD